MFHIGDPKSMNICKKGICCLLKQYQREINAVEADEKANDDEQETMDEDDGEAEDEELVVDDTVTAANDYKKNQRVGHELPW